MKTSFELTAPLMKSIHQRVYSSQHLCREGKILQFAMNYSCCWVKRDKCLINFIIYLFASMSFVFSIYDSYAFSWSFVRIVYDIFICLFIWSRILFFYIDYQESQIYFYFDSKSLKNTKLYTQLRIIIISFIIFFIIGSSFYFIHWLYEAQILNHPSSTNAILEVLAVFLFFIYAFWIYYIPGICASFLIAIYCWKCVDLMNEFKVKVMNNNKDINLGYEYLKIHEEIHKLTGTYSIQIYFAVTIMFIVVLLWWILSYELFLVYHGPFDITYNLMGFSFVILINYPMIYYIILMNKTGKLLIDYIIKEMVSCQQQDIQQRLSQLLIIMSYKQIGFTCFGFIIDAKRLISPIIVYVSAKIVAFLYDWIINKEIH